MKVVIAHNRYSSAQPSGENTIVDTEIRQLTEAGVEVVPFQRSSDEIGDQPLSEKLLLPVSPVYAPRAQRELTELITRERPDVVHLHNPYPLLSPWVVKTAHKLGVPVVQTVHNYRQSCANGLYFRDGRICRDCLGKPFPYPAVQHSCYRGSKAQSLIMATTLAAHRGTWRSLDQFIALTPAIAEHLLTLGIREDQITVKPNSIPDHGYSREPGEGLLFVGRLSEEKGVRLLLDSWARSATGRLRIIGDGPLRELVEKAAADREDIDYLGPQNADGVRAAMRSANALVIASTWLEPLPTVIIEALSNGTPVLGTNLGGIPYLVGDAGWLVEPTVDAMSAAIPRAAAGGLRPEARARYLENFTPAVVLDRLIGVYEKVRRSAAS
ncbi:glycosyltransferase family 4 protein [Longispora sp. NPDC051575]|uniref:glycosyltransferase family 4 protein n=1 Tax=Longispora sp. NPDC051575 TaxID=3154943 RepID=UPI003432DAD4